MMTPISSMCPASMIVGPPDPFTSARLLPATSPLTVENCLACSHQILAGAPSKPEGPGVSRSFLRKLSESGEIIGTGGCSWESVVESSIAPGGVLTRTGLACCPTMIDGESPLVSHTDYIQPR